MEDETHTRGSTLSFERANVNHLGVQACIGDFAFEPDYRVLDLDSINAVCVNIQRQVAALIKRVDKHRMARLGVDAACLAVDAHCLCSESTRAIRIGD